MTYFNGGLDVVHLGRGVGGKPPTKRKTGSPICGFSSQSFEGYYITHQWHKVDCPRCISKLKESLREQGLKIP